MGLLDLLRELRTSEPDPAKAARAVRFLGWACVLAGAWNFVLPQVAPIKESEAPFPTSYPYYALAVLGLIGSLFLLSARGISELTSWGKRAAQSGIVLLLLTTAIFLFRVLPEHFRFPSEEHGFPMVFHAFMAIALAQFAVPAYYGFLHLGRLPTTDDQSGTRLQHVTSTRIRSQARMEGARTLASVPSHKNSPSPLGIMGTFPLFIAIPLLVMLVIKKHAGPEYDALLFPLVFGCLFIAPTIFNYLPSPFEKNRTILKSYTGGGSIYLFHGSWPFFRLIVYRDALEVRVMFHRFLIPFEKMRGMQDKATFLTTGILIQSDVPGVPPRIRFGGFRMKKVLESVQATRTQFMNGANQAS